MANPHMGRAPSVKKSYGKPHISQPRTQISTQESHATVADINHLGQHYAIETVLLLE